MKPKKTVKLSLNKVTVSNLGIAHMSGVRGGLAEQNLEPYVAQTQYDTCLDCTLPIICGTIKAKSCIGPSCAGTCLPTCGNSCAVPPLACAVPDDDAIY